MEDKLGGIVPSVRSRREFLGALGAGAAVLSAGGFLGGCSSSSSPAATSASSSGKPVRGGTLRIGLTGGASTDTLFPLAQVTPPDLARSPQLFNSLIAFDSNAQLRLQLAEEMVPNSNATEWTIRVKKGITFHNGKTLGADDVIFTLQQCLNPKSPAPTAALLVPLDLAGVKMLDQYTVRIPFKTPYSAFPQMIQNYNLPIMPVGFDLKHPVGTGPYEYVSFTPGVTSTFKRNPNYWEPGLPYTDEVIITDYSDETSLTNALLSNDEDAIGAIEIASAPTVANGGMVVVYSNAGGITPFTMRCDQPPFNDVRVRQAMRLIIDRPQMRELVFGGHGLLGNDVTSPFDVAYDKSLPQRVQDIPQAKFLLKAAGYENLKVTLVTSPIQQGAVLAATVLAQQAKAANVDVALNVVPTSEFYGANYLKWTFAQDFYFYSPYMLQVTDAFLPTSPYNESHFDEARYTSLYGQAQAITTQSALTPVEQEMMQIDYEQGGYILPYFNPVIDSHSPRLQGVLPAQTGAALRNFEFKYFWFK
jgi:peptide/nickel transport system substrate-binding protein